jgi:phosphoglycerate kinase
MTGFLSVRDLDVKGLRVFLRLDLNVPLRAGAVSDDTRVRAAVPTLVHLLDRGARVLACSHMGRPKGKAVPELSLKPVAERLRDLLPGRRIFFAADPLGEDARTQAGALKPGECLLLENIRFEPGETKGDEGLARRIREMADCYVSDAFGAVHRPHASVCAAPKLFSKVAVGFLVEREIDYLGGLLGNPQRPYVAFLGGAKVSDKIPVITSLLDKVDVLGIGGAMAYTFLAAQGRPVGSSRMEADLAQACREISARAASQGVRLLLPSDHRAAASLDPGEPVTLVTGEDFPPGLAGFDIGPATSAAYSREAAKARTIFWNGPMGVFEHPAFAAGTVALARAVASSGALSVVGGGDSVAAVQQAGVADRISHISTGGGASLEFLTGVELPGLEVLRRG